MQTIFCVVEWNSRHVKIWHDCDFETSLGFIYVACIFERPRYFFEIWIKWFLWSAHSLPIDAFLCAWVSEREPHFMLILFVFCALEHVLWSGYVEVQYSPPTVNRNTHMQFNTSITAHYPSVAEFISLPSLDRKKSHSDLKSVFFMHARKYRSSENFYPLLIETFACARVSFGWTKTVLLFLRCTVDGNPVQARIDWIRNRISLFMEKPLLPLM